MSHSHTEGGNTNRHDHGDGHVHVHDARPIHPRGQAKEAACADDGCGACAMPATPPQSGAPSARGRSFRIATMDCAAEEAEIRRALDGMPGIRGLRFQLGQRVLTIDADEPSIAPALAAVRKSGFDRGRVETAVKERFGDPGRLGPPHLLQATAPNTS